jgi:hypothetical protein
MAIIEQTTEIDAPIDLVYQVSQDYSVRYEWDPFPEKISVVNGSHGQMTVGTQVLVRSKARMEMLVEFVQIAPPKRAAIKMVRGPWFIAKFAGSWIFEVKGPETTIARFKYSISTRPTLLRWLLDPIAGAYFHRTATKRLVGLKRYCESDECRKLRPASGSFGA